METVKKTTTFCQFWTQISLWHLFTNVPEAVWIPVPYFHLIIHHTPLCISLNAATMFAAGSMVTAGSYSLPVTLH